MDVKNGPGGDDYQNNKGAVEGEELQYLRWQRINHLCGEEFASTGRSSSVYCRKAEGVPFKWEKKPGTPQLIIPNEEINNIPVVPLSPPPCLQSSELPLPCFHHHTDTPPHYYVFNSWRRKIKKMLQQHAKIIIAQKSSSSSRRGGGGLQHKSSSHHQRQNVGVGDSDTDDFQFIASLNNSSSSSSSSFSSCSNAPFCYASPWNIKAALMDEEAGKKNNNSSKEPRPPHNKAPFFRLQEEEEEDGFRCRSLLSRSRLSLSSESSRRFYYCMSTAKGIIPFQWEIQAGAPKTPRPGNDLLLIPPPPLAQSLALPKPPQSQTSPSWTKLWKANKRLMAAAAARIRKKLS